MKLKILLDGILECPLSADIEDFEVNGVYCDSRKVQPDGIFLAMPGENSNGADYLDDVFNKGIKIAFVEKRDYDLSFKEDWHLLMIDDIQKFSRQIVRKFYQEPSQKTRVIGITGTNGKTTVSYLIESILHEAERSCSVIGTVNYRIGERILPAQNTTPGFFENQRLLADMANDGVDYCVMEVSSHALVQERVDLINFRSAVFTNLTSDHLDYHKTRDNYFAAKAKMFVDLSSESISVINVDDECGRKLFSKTPSEIFTYGIEKNADVMAIDIQLDISGTSFKIISPQGDLIIQTSLVGQYNIYNILAAVSIGITEEISLDKIKKGIERIDLVPGRLESLNYGQDFSVFIDYAHTQDALFNVLSAIKEVTDAKIILVFGCGGNRDKTKRPEMGKIAGEFSDFSFVTSDNPRGENPGVIIREIAEGFENENYRIIENRQEAIEKALDYASSGDIVLISGKGHENYQIFKGQTVAFDERQIIRQWILS